MSAATFTLSGPASYTGSGTSWTQANAPTGAYTITFGAIPGYTTPVAQTQTLSAGGTISFAGTYDTSTTGTVSINEFPVPTSFSYPPAITAGPDGNLWFTEYYGNNIGRITPGGVIEEFPVPTATSGPNLITAGPDGNLWFTEQNASNIGRITSGGVVKEFPDAGGPNAITAGPDGNLWFTEWNGNNIGRITPSGVIQEFPVPTGGSNPGGITAGPDGNLWFTEVSGNNIGRITPSGVIKEFPVPTCGSSLGAITAGPDGNLWFTEVSGNKIGRITPIGVIKEFPVLTGGSDPFGITAGPDGNLWFTEVSGNNIGRITPGGVIKEFTVPTAASRPDGITEGPDGNLWFTEESGNKIGRIVIAPGTGTIQVTTDLSAATFTLSGPAGYTGSGTSWTQANAPTGAYTITFGAVPGYTTPAPQTQTLTTGGTITFAGAYGGLVGWWTFDSTDISGSTALDKSGLGNNGTIYGATATSGKIGQALHFDGDSYVDLGNPSSLHLMSYSISAWVRPAGLGWEQRIVSNGGFGNVNGAIDFLIDANGKLVILNQFNGGQDTYRSNPIPFQVGTWIHVAVTYDSTTGAPHLYVDGSEVPGIFDAGSSLRPPRQDPLYDFNIGTNGLRNSYFYGDIDEVRIYSRALSASEVNGLYLTE
ncbi:MAG: LamG-like jellyroll fold domain-containing protein [Bryobacteraceae bacterium]